MPLGVAITAVAQAVIPSAADSVGPSGHCSPRRAGDPRASRCSRRPSPPTCTGRISSAAGGAASADVADESRDRADDCGRHRATLPGTIGASRGRPALFDVLLLVLRDLASGSPDLWPRRRRDAGVEPRAFKNSVEALTYERLDTRSHVEVALFTKLIFVYGLNTVAVPLFVSFLTLYDPIEQAPVLHVVGITQAWYESGGAVSRAVILMLSSSIVTDLFRYIHIPALINRHILGRFASSQIRLNQLWAPPPVPLGGIYAETFRTLLLGVVYAPIYPPALLLTAFALLSSYLSTRYAISRWYMRPPLVNGSLMKRMRNACEWLALIGAFVTAATGVGMARA